jgi:hypothetical protein
MITAILWCAMGAPQAEAPPASSPLEFRYLVKDITFATPVGPSDSTQNPGNLLGLPSFQLENEIRADFFLDYKALRLLAKPRMSFFWQRWTEGFRSGESDFDTDFFVNEFRAIVTPDDKIFFSYGRENLQWGPSFFLSPSNPFHLDNGQRNPKREVAGTDYAKATWIPNQTWTVSAIANLFEGDELGRETGRGLRSEFERTYALKLDYTGFRKYGSVIASYREPGEDEEGEGLRIGGFSGWSVSEAFLLHVEASGTVQNGKLYPTTAPSSPFGRVMAPSKVDTGGFGGIVLGGGSYTFDVGPTVVVEYIFNSQGYSDDEAEDYLGLRRSASEGLSEPFPISTDAITTLTQTLATGLRLQRQNYLMLQYQQPQIRGLLDLVFRYSIGLDDQSSQLISVAQYGIGDRVQVFLVGSQNLGSIDGEARSIVDYAYSFGVEVAF